ncbi:hypothetical protein RI367_004894 [Sorochytrium milnesiophthora]
MPRVSWVGRSIYLLGVVLLLHSAYSALEHISYLKAVDKTGEGLTTDIKVEAVVAMLLCFVGIVQVADPLQNISLEAELKRKSLESLESRQGFHAFGHRGKYLFGAVDMKSLQATKSS